MDLEVIDILPDNNEKKIPPLIFVHGSFHSAWCWEEHFLPYFAGMGYSCYAPSLRGHGKSAGYEALDSYGLMDYAEDILQVMATLDEKPLLIGHSMGGAIVQKLLEHCQDRIEAVVLMNSVPPQGMDFGIALRLMTRGFGECLQLYRFQKAKSKNPDSSTPFPANCLFSLRVPKEKRSEYCSKLQRESMKASKDMAKVIIAKPETVKLPVLVMGSRKDWFFSEAVVGCTGEAYGTKAVIFDECGHDMMLEPDWKAVADKIVHFINEYTTKI